MHLYPLSFIVISGLFFEGVGKELNEWFCGDFKKILAFKNSTNTRRIVKGKYLFDWIASEFRHLRRVKLTVF
jgi:hypothetical protein